MQKRGVVALVIVVAGFVCVAAITNPTAFRSVVIGGGSSDADGGGEIGDAGEGIFSGAWQMGTIDSTPIGGVTPSTGAFTTLSATGEITGADGINVVGGAQFDTLNVTGEADLTSLLLDSPLAIAEGGTGADNYTDALTNLHAQPSDATLTALAGLTTGAYKVPYFTGTDTASTFTTTAYALTLVDDSDAATARGTLGLGTMATQAASAVAITGGTVNNVTMVGPIATASANPTVYWNASGGDVGRKRVALKYSPGASDDLSEWQWFQITDDAYTLGTKVMSLDRTGNLYIAGDLSATELAGTYLELSGKSLGLWTCAVFRENDSHEGSLFLYGNSTTQGGYICYYNSADYDTSFQSWLSGSFSGHFMLIGSNTFLDCEDGASPKMTLGQPVVFDSRTSHSTITTFTANDTTPSVAGGNLFYIPGSGWTAGNNITRLDGGTIGQEVTIMGGDSDCVMNDASPLFLAGAWTSASTDTITLIYSGTVWYEKCRSNN